MDSPFRIDPNAREIALRYLTQRDGPWIRIVLEEYERFEGRPRRELRRRLREPLPCDAPLDGLRFVRQVLDRAYGSRVQAAVSPVAARSVLFETAAASRGPTADVIADCAHRLHISVEDLERSLFADVPDERRVTPPDAPMSVTDLALRTNLAMAQHLLRRSTAVWIIADGSVRAVVRHAKLRGLICTVMPGSGQRPVLSISGPFSLFRRTTMYGRALGELVPFLGLCGRYHLESEALVGGVVRRFILRSGDPIATCAPPHRYDSRLEERFAQELRKAAPEYDLVREPRPIPAGGTLIFPDFALRDRTHPTREWLIEVLGFWTPEYLARKLALLRSARISNLIVCIDKERNCGEGDLLPGAGVVRYRKRIDPKQVLDAIAAMTPT